MKPPNNKYNHKIPEIREAVSYESKRRKKDTTKKKTGYNIYGIREDMFIYGSARICALIVLTIMQIGIAGFSTTVKVILDVIVLVIVAVVAVWKNRQRQEKVEAYRRQEGFEFIGLYDLSGEQNLKSSDILSREEEVTYLNQVLEDLIFRQDSVKQALCLTGKSGCGKIYDPFFLPEDLWRNLSNL